ncbi:MAG: DUF4419 domain-containing protein [Phaeodactylibacter sp.]|nr:DUF4419 domain-containing protein [Phaeodactylibacter sp.]
MVKYLTFLLLAILPLKIQKPAPEKVLSDPSKVTFQVCDVERANQPLQVVAIEPLIQHRIQLSAPYPTKYNLEDYYEGSDSLVNISGNALAFAVRQAYANHRPLELSPDIIWLTIAQGFAIHINENAEALRDSFVDFEGKKTLEIYRDFWRKGDRNNDWPGTFTEFSELIEKNTGPKVRDLVTAEFSTTGPTEKAAFEVALMDAMQSYFDYRVSISCGIPEITLTGTTADWKALELKAAALGKYGLEWWMDALLPVLAEFTSASKGEVNLLFWQSMYDHVSFSVGCGSSSFITGWIKNLFPYLYTKQQNGYMVHPKTWAKGVITKKGKINKHQTVEKFQSEFPFNTTSRETGGIEFDDLPDGLSTVPFEWKTRWDGEFKMELMAGFTGVHQDPETLNLRPEIGWIVVEKVEPEGGE